MRISTLSALNSDIENQANISMDISSSYKIDHTEWLEKYLDNDLLYSPSESNSERELDVQSPAPVC